MPSDGLSTPDTRVAPYFYMNKKVLNQLLFIFASWLFLPINTFGFFSDFFSSSDIPKGWITQKSPVSRSIIYTPPDWPRGKSGIANVWGTIAYEDTYLALRKFRIPKPPFRFEDCTKYEFLGGIISAQFALAFEIYELNHDFEMDGEDAAWAKYKFMSATKNWYFGFSAVTWKDGFLFVFDSEGEQELPSETIKVFTKVARISELK